MKGTILLRAILAVVLGPFVLLGLVVSMARLWGLVRYDPAYFTEAYVARYSTPTAVAGALGSALQNNDRGMLAELQGLRWPAAFEADEGIVGLMLWERTDRYVTYVSRDPSASESDPYYVEQVKGRWVVSPPDLYYYVESRAYQRVFLPLAVVWWASGALTIAVMLLFSTSERI